MRYQTIVQKGMMIIFQNEFDAESEREAQKIHFENLRICNNEIAEDWDSVGLALIDEQGDIVRFVL